MKKLIGWRTSDFLRETADRKLALNWANHHEVLPIFDDDPNTELGGKRTGWPAEGRLMQDDHKGLSRFFSEAPGAARLARQAAAEAAIYAQGITLDNWSLPLPKGLPVYPKYRPIPNQEGASFVVALVINGKECYSKAKFYRRFQVQQHIAQLLRNGTELVTFKDYFE